jgi:hypothetical protein
MIENVMKEITSWETKSTLEKGGEHHNLFCVRCWDFFPFCRLPLEHHSIWEEVILNKFVDFSLVRSRLLEHAQVRGVRGEGKENLGEK